MARSAPWSTGDVQVGTLKATGSAMVDVNGATTTLNVDAELVRTPASRPRSQGAVVITDGLAETVSLDAAVNGQVTMGDATLTGANLHIASTYGNPLDALVLGRLDGRAPRRNLSGSLDATLRARTARCSASTAR